MLASGPGPNFCSLNILQGVKNVVVESRRNFVQSVPHLIQEAMLAFGHRKDVAYRCAQAFQAVGDQQAHLAAATALDILQNITP